MKNKIILLKLSYEYKHENFDIFPCVIQDEKNLVLVDWFGGCTVVETPGHTPGHTSLYLKNEKIFITGDNVL